MGSLTSNIIDEYIRASMVFRLLFRTQDDRYKCYEARHVVAAMTGLDDQTCAVTIKLMAIDAQRDFTAN